MDGLPNAGGGPSLPVAVDVPIRHPLSERFHAILKELGALHDKKQQDYGRVTDPFANVRASELFGVPGWQGAIMRGNDKMVRIQAFCLKGDLANESLEDSLRDLAVYAVMALVLREQALSGLAG